MGRAMQMKVSLHAAAVQRWATLNALVRQLGRLVNASAQIDQLRGSTRSPDFFASAVTVDRELEAVAAAVERYTDVLTARLLSESLAEQKRKDA